MLILAVEPSSPSAVASIIRVAKNAGLREVQKCNVSNILSHARGLAARVDEGWVLTTQGKEYLKSRKLIPDGSLLVRDVLTELRNHAATISNLDTKRFLDEAIGCLEAGFYRAAIVFSWVRAMSVLYDYVVNNRLTDFNKEATRLDPKLRVAKNADDLARMKEDDFLDRLESLSIIGKSVKQQLQSCLTLRNGCGHPNSLQVGQHQAAAHVESLIQNVFGRF